MPKRRVLAGVGIGVSLMAALWIAGRVSRPDSEPASEVATQAVTHSDLERPLVPELVSQPDRRAAPARHTIAAGSSGRAQPMAAAAEPRAAADTTPEPSAAIASAPANMPEPSGTTARAAVETAEPSGLKSGGAPATASQTSASTSPASKPLAAATPEQPRPAGLSVSTTKDTTEIFVPVTGSLAGLATKIWTDPAAVVVEIPRGQVGLTKRKYDIQKDGVVGISVGKPGGVAQIRVYVNSILSQYNASAVPGGVSIRIKRDLQSLP